MSDVLTRAQENYQRDKDHWEEIYRKARDDMYFISDNEDAQWEANDRTLRGRRPCLTIDQLGQFIHKVANTIRMNTPTINIIPGTDSDVETADIFKGLIKNIEYRSNADEAYDTGSLSSIRCSIGFIFVDHGYVNNTGFEQELTIKRCVEALQCWIDCDSIEADGSDARRGIKLQPMSAKEFKRRYPGKKVSSFGDDIKSAYKDDDSVMVAEYYEIIEDTKEVGLNSLGQMEEVVQDVEYSSLRTLKKQKVMRYILSGAEVLAESSFPGKFIPIVPVYGEEAWIDGKRQLYSLIRKSKDAQRMYNYWKSLETELLMKQPNAPIIAAAGTVENYKEDWQYPEKSMVLRFDAFDKNGNPSPAPNRLAPPTIPTGIVNAARATVDDIKATMGLYNASIGQQSNETSGVAISRRKEEGDTATYHFGDNLVRSVTQVGRILVCAIPEVYDTARIIQIIGPEDEPQAIGVNGAMAPNQERPFDLTKGEYSVRVIAGDSYTTKRQEAAAFFQGVVEKQPQLMQVMGDLLFKNMDVAGAQAMSERMKKVIDPKLLDDNQQADPEKEQMKAVIEQGRQLLQQQQAQMADLQQQLKSKDNEIQVKAMSEQNKADHEQGKNQIEILKLNLDHQKAEQDNAYKMEDLQLQKRALDLQEAQMLITAQAQKKQMEIDGQKETVVVSGSSPQELAPANS